jgi:hypothetical protein
VQPHVVSVGERVPAAFVLVDVEPEEAVVGDGASDVANGQDGRDRLEALARGIHRRTVERCPMLDLNVD